MSEKIVNALAQMKQVYLESVSHNDLEQKRINEERIQINEFKNPKLDPVGDEDSDVDNDGDVDSSDSYLQNRRNVVTSKVNGDLEKEIIKAMKRLKNGSTPNSDESADNVQKMMYSISGLRPPVKENTYYSWRDTVDESLLWEIIDELEQKQVKEKKVNNYSGKDPVVSVNPEMKTESFLIDSEELNEDFIEESIDIATEYLCEEGLSVEEVEELIDELGVDEFSEWVMQLGYETLFYEQTFQGELLTKELKARKKPEVSKRPGASSVVQHTPSRTDPEVPSPTRQAKGQLSLDFSKKKSSNTRGKGFTPTSTPNPRRVPTGAAQRKQDKKEKRASNFKNKLELRKNTLARNIASVEQLPKRPKITSTGRVTPQSLDDRTGRTKRTRSSVNTTKFSRPPGQEKPTATTSEKGPNPEVRNMVRGAVADAAEFINRGRKAGEAARKKGLAAGLRSFFFKPEYHEEFEMWVDNLLEEGYDLSEYTWDELYEEYEDLQEKAVLEQQQKIFGLALSVKRGETSRSKVSDKVLEIVDSMSEKEIRKYAKTSHEGIPKTVDESFLVEKVIDFIRNNR